MLDLCKERNLAPQGCGALEIAAQRPFSEQHPGSSACAFWIIGVYFTFVRPQSSGGGWRLYRRPLDPADSGFAPLDLQELTFVRCGVLVPG